MPGEIYKNRTRIRVNGLLIDDNTILLVQIKSPVNNKLVWMPPGGGLHFGENMKECLGREFEEETGLKIEVDSLIAVNEMVQPPFHAVECYFSVRKKSGKLALGHDPEQSAPEQVLKDLQWISLDELRNIEVAPEQLPDWLASVRSQQEFPRRYFHEN